MPTGYTAELMEKGQTFSEFALRCARAFGALIEMRDSSLDAEIPAKFEPSSYRQESLKRHIAELERFKRMSNQEMLAFGEFRKTAHVKMLEEWKVRDATANKRLGDMAEKVKRWKPPSDDHVGLKEFMLEQIDASREKSDYVELQIAKAKAKPPSDYYADAVLSEAKGIEYDNREIEEERKRVEGRNAWVQQLRESLASYEETSHV
jgi:hypothetical protein